MSLTEKQTNKAEAPCQAKGRPTRTRRTSVIAEALRYEAVQGAPPMDMVDGTPSPNFSAPLEPAQTSVFSAFGKDAAKGPVESFDTVRPSNNTYADKAPANDMAKQCSMVHRMMEMDKTDVDPRDLHKLLPSTMLTSESLDLRPDGKLARGMSGMDLHKLLEDQAMKFNAERGKGAQEQELSPEEASRLSPTVEEQDANGHPIEKHMSSGNQGTSGEQPVPNSPVTGWPAAAVLGMIHPMNNSLQQVVKPAPHTASPPELMAAHNPLVYAESSSSMARLNGAPRGVLLDWTAAYGGQQMYAPPVYPPTTSTPVILEHPGQEEQYAMNYHQSVAQPSSENASPDEPSSPRESDTTSSDKDPNSDAASKKFKSLEAALAWCHVQHSQKQVPVVPKDDVRKLVDFQLNSGKPIRAPWYRPQSDKPEDAEQPPEKPVVKKPVPPPPMPRVKKTSSKMKKQGTGFFCPPGSSLAHV